MLTLCEVVPFPAPSAVDMIQPRPSINIPVNKLFNYHIEHLLGFFLIYFGVLFIK